jgi:CRISPR-associated endoribonuclease Cas6
MRLCLEIEAKRGMEVPPCSRAQVLSLIKEAFRRSDEFGGLFLQKWYNGNIPKPFSFSVYFPLSKKDGKVYLTKDYFRIIFSTSDYEFLHRFYNGVLKLVEEYKLFGNSLKIKNKFLLPKRKFARTQAILKTISPLLLRDKENTNTYLYPVDGPIKDKDIQLKAKYWKGVELDDYKKALEENLSYLAKERVSITEILIKEVFPVPVCSTRHSFKVTYPGVKCYLKLSGSPSALELLYYIGIGARRSEGFGMLELEGGQ